MHDIDHLRSHLFATLTALQDKDNPMEIERAKAVCDVGDVIISAAKAEIDFARVNGNVDTLFFHKPVLNGQERVPLLLEQQTGATKHKVHHGKITVENGVTKHELKK